MYQRVLPVVHAIRMENLTRIIGGTRGTECIKS